MNAVLGATGPLKGMIAYTHMMEWVTGYESQVSGLIFCYDNSLFVICPIMLLIITNNTNIFLYCGLTINVVALIIFAIFYFPESPVFLLDSGKWDEFNIVLSKLYQVNNLSLETQLEINTKVLRFKS